MTDACPLDSKGDSGALVLFSGGQDSATCLAWSLERFSHVETVGFDYGQRHAVELTCRVGFLKTLVEVFPSWAMRLGADHVLKLDTLASLSETAMTRDVEITLRADGLPNTFVPGRNLLFFTYAAALAYRRGLRHLVGGMCETDYSGYPDCRDNTLKALQVTLNLGMASRFILHTPLMWRDKASTWELAGQIGGTALNALILEMTHSCYLGDRRQRHPWGYGCASCPACTLRQAGWEKWQRRAPDKQRSPMP